MAHDAINVPSWLNVTAVTGSEWAGKVFIGLALATSHTLTVSSNPPETRRLHLGLKLTQKTKLVCPLSILTVSPYQNTTVRQFAWRRPSEKVPTVSILHILIVLSSDADARNSQSLDQAMSEIPSVWPTKVSRSSPFSQSHIFTSLSAANLHWFIPGSVEDNKRVWLTCGG